MKKRHTLTLLVIAFAFGACCVECATLAEEQALRVERGNFSMSAD